MMKKVKNTFKFLAVLILFVSCNYSSEKKDKIVNYSKNGLSFALPKYWKVTKDKLIEGTKDSRLISISNEEPFAKDAYLIITEINKEVSLPKTMDRLINNLRAGYVNRKVDFGLLNEPVKVKIGDINTIRTDFETKIITTRNRGNITVLNLMGKTYSFVFSSEIKEWKENSAVVDTAIKSLRVGNQ